MPEDDTTAPEAREVEADPRDAERRDVETAAGEPLVDGSLGLEPGHDPEVEPGDLNAHGEPHSSLERLPAGVAPDGVGPDEEAGTGVGGGGAAGVRDE